MKMDSHVTTRLKCTQGLADLAGREYKSAAKNFLAASLDHCEMPDIMSAQVINIYIYISSSCISLNLSEYMMNILLVIPVLQNCGKFIPIVGRTTF